MIYWIWAEAWAQVKRGLTKEEKHPRKCSDMVVFPFLAKKSLSCSESVTNTDYDNPYKLSWLVWVNGRVGMARMMPDSSQMSSPCSSGCMKNHISFFGQKKPLEPLRAAHEPLWVIFISSAYQTWAINMTPNAESSRSRAEPSRGNTRPVTCDRRIDLIATVVVAFWHSVHLRISKSWAFYGCL